MNLKRKKRRCNRVDWINTHRTGSLIKTIQNKTKQDTQSTEIYYEISSVLSWKSSKISTHSKAEIQLEITQQSQKAKQIKLKKKKRRWILVEKTENLSPPGSRIKVSTYLQPRQSKTHCLSHVTHAVYLGRRNSEILFLFKDKIIYIKKNNTNKNTKLRRKRTLTISMITHRCHFSIFPADFQLTRLVTLLKNLKINNY